MAVAEASSPTQRIFRRLISPTKSDAKPSPLSFSVARGTRSFACGFILTFVACTFLFVLNPVTRSSSSSSPWLPNLFASSSSYRSHFSSMLSRFRRNPSESTSLSLPPSPPRPRLPGDLAVSRGGEGAAASRSDWRDDRKRSGSGIGSAKRARDAALGSRENGGDVNGESPSRRKKKKKKKERTENWPQPVKKCDVYAGRWVRDESYPLYSPGSCPHIDEPFNCFLNGRRDSGYLKYRWQPKDCNIPR